MSLFARHPGAATVGGLPGAVGARILGAYGHSVGLLGTLGGALAAPLTPGRAASAVANQIALRQVFYTGFQAVSLVSVIAGFLGATMILQMKLMAGALPGDVVGKILVTVILRELAPLVTAIVVSGRSGTAIATELGNMRANSEILGLSSLGIDPLRFIVWPRLVGCIISVMVLTVYFGMVAIMGGYAVGLVLDAASVTDLQSGFASALGVGDLVLYLVKSTGLGLIVGWLCCHFGLSVQNSPTEVPQKASQAVIMSLLASVIFNTVVTAAFYWVVGPPIG
jgi:phospholipid/cholesterol/gamma-HCH transport system permease protein